MRAAPVAFVLALMIAFASPARADERVTIVHQGIVREALLHQPPAVAAGAAPLIVALQGFGQNTDSLKQWLRLDAVADRDGFRVLYPEAIQHSWSYGRPINQRMPLAGTETADDIGFIRRLIDQSGRAENRRSSPYLRHRPLARRPHVFYAGLCARRSGRGGRAADHRDDRVSARGLPSGAPDADHGAGRHRRSGSIVRRRAGTGWAPSLGARDHGLLAIFARLHGPDGAPAAASRCSRQD